MNSRKLYKIFRRRQQLEYWVDITTHYDVSGEICEYELAKQYAKEYKTFHKSDGVKIVIITETDEIIAL